MSPIVGVTVTEQGELIQRLAVTTRISIGEIKQAQSGQTYPSKLDHFRFLRKGKGLEWVPDPELTKKFGEKPREIDIVLMDNDIDTVFRTEFAWWTKTAKQCWGDGREATRRTEAAPRGEQWPIKGAEIPGCGFGCPDLEGGKCKPSGTLYFMLRDRPQLGGACKIDTRSYRSIRQIFSALQQFKSTLGRLEGICCKLVVHPEKSSFRDKGVLKPTTIYALSLEMGESDFRGMLMAATGPARMIDETRRLLGTAKKVDYIEVADEESEEEVAARVQPEFYPDKAAREAQEAAEEKRKQDAAAELPQEENLQPAMAPEAKISAAQWTALEDISQNNGWKKADWNALFERNHWTGPRDIPVSRFDGLMRLVQGGLEEEAPYQPQDEDIPW
jgi:hypothetical protein